MKTLGVAMLLFWALPAWAGSTVTARQAALSTASPFSTSIGLSVMREGGNAIDAAVAAAFALAVAHPQAGNLGGGGFLLYYEAASGGVWALDFRETAPGAATREMYMQSDGTPSQQSRTGVLASGVPGTVAGLWSAHQRFGSKRWNELLRPAEALAREGFQAGEELQRELGEEQSERKIDSFPSTASLFYPGGKPVAAGVRLVQPELAATLSRIAAHGASDFYEGETAKRLVQAVQSAGGIISLRDLRQYKPLWRAPMKIRFRDYSLLTMPPPSAGGLLIAEMLNILSGFDLAEAGFQTARSIHLQAEAARRAYIDRNRYVGDPGFSRIPYRELLSMQRAAQWRKSIDPRRATPTAMLAPPSTSPVEGSETTHFSIVDRAGNIVSLTTTLNENFGSGWVVPGLGFFLNNEMDDFTTAPGKPNRYGMVQSPANEIAAGKRMASSMTPLIVLRRGKPVMALGTRGGPTIPTTVLQIFLHVAVHQRSLPDAVAAPRYHHQAYPEDIYYEESRHSPSVLHGLNAMGHGVRGREPIGDVHALAFENGRIIAVADPRRGGAAGGF